MNTTISSPIVEQTADGSATLYVPTLDEHYHSVKGALTEAQHVYIDCALRHRASTLHEARPLRVLEIGLGTGLNAALTAKTANQSLTVHYFAIEKYPVAPELVAQLDYKKYADPQMMSDIHQATWDADVTILPYFCLHKIGGDLLTHPLPPQIDVVYFDAFAPEKQPEMWSEAIFQRIFETMAPQGVLTTYCAKGLIRRLLRSVGFCVERLAGPIGGKREILRATKM